MQRVTTLGSTNTTTAWIRQSAERLAEGQQQIATGRRLNVASEAPTDAATLLRNQRSLDRLRQFDRNNADARQWLATGDTALNDTVASLTKAKTLAVQGANGINTAEARGAIADDLRAMANEIVTLANSTVNGRSIFSGTSGADRAYDQAGNYLGDAGQVRRTVSPTDSFVVAATGPAVFGTSNPTDPYNGTAFQRLNAVADAVEAGDINAVRDGIEAVDSAISQVQGEIGRLGNLASRLDAVISRNEASQISTRSQISEVRDVDMGDAIVRLRAAETSYEATLSAAARSLGRSLLDFLR